MDTFRRIKLEGWRQFEAVDIGFDSRITVLTGVNGCGKTTILNILGKHFGWNLNLISAPKVSEKKQSIFWSDVWKILEKEEASDQRTVTIGSIVYKSGMSSDILAATGKAQYHISFSQQRTVEGLNIPSHRPIVSYSPINDIPTNAKSSAAQFQAYRQLLLEAYGSDTSRNPGRILKQSLISLAVFGYGSAAVTANIEFRDIFESFQQVLRNLLPKSLKFQGLNIKIPEVILKTDTGDFALDSMSGGIAALLGIAWQIHMFGWQKPNCTVLIDEPENHLHPKMQREILPSLAKAFPTFNFIVATHSPFVVSSFQEASVYGLVYGDQNRVRSVRFEEANLSGSANEILRDLLEVDSTIPIWVEERLKAALHHISAKGTVSAAEVYAELKRQGLESSVGEFVAESEP